MTATYRIASIPGDGIGKEVVPAAKRVLDRVSARRGFVLAWDEYEWGCEHYQREGRLMPGNGLEVLRAHDAIFFGAVGAPGVPDHVSLWGLLIPIRRNFRQCVNVRPIRLLRGVHSPLRGVRAGEIEFVCVRENNEGEYSEIGGRLYQGREEELAIQEAVFTRRGIERVMHYAYNLARSRRRRLASITKSNGIMHTMPFWDDVFRDVGEQYPDVQVETYHADAAAALLVLRPKHFDVVVASNLLGDILSEVGAAVVGSIAMAASANIDPTREFPSMFEPIHGSAPDIAGKGIANPVGQIWAGALMLDYLEEHEAANDVMAAVENVLESGTARTPDLGGAAGTVSVTEAILEALPVVSEQREG